MRMVYYTRINLNISALIHGVRAALTWQLTSFSDSLLQLVVPSLAKTRRHSIMITFKVYFLLVYFPTSNNSFKKRKKSILNLPKWKSVLHLLQMAASLKTTIQRILFHLSKIFLTKWKRSNKSNIGQKKCKKSGLLELTSLSSSS